MASNDEKQSIEAQTSKEFIGLKEFFSIFAKIVGAVAGFAALFVFFGYTIILSFINSDQIKLYGLTSFPQDFYKEAGISFMNDIFLCYGHYSGHTRCFILLLLVFVGVYFFVKRKHLFIERFKTIFSLVPPIIILLIILLTLKLNILPDRFLFISEFKRMFLFTIAVPVVVGMFLYLALHFRDFVNKPYRSYYMMIFLFLGLLITIPISYGEHLYDINAFHVEGLDFSDDIKIKSLIKLKQDINAQGENKLFYIMGHTMGREVFFDNQFLSPPAKAILVERDLIKYLKISKEYKYTVRNLLRESIQKIKPVISEEDLKTKQLSIEDALPKDIEDLFKGSKR